MPETENVVVCWEIQVLLLFKLQHIYNFVWRRSNYRTQKTHKNIPIPSNNLMPNFFFHIPAWMSSEKGLENKILVKKSIDKKICFLHWYLWNIIMVMMFVVYAGTERHKKKERRRNGCFWCGLRIGQRFWLTGAI